MGKVKKSNIVGFKEIYHKYLKGAKDGDILDIKEWGQTYMKYTGRSFKPKKFIFRKESLPDRQRTVDAFNVASQESYYMYRKRRRNTKFSENHIDFSKAIQAIGKAMAEVMVDNEAGLFLKDYGYFTPAINLVDTEKGYNPYNHLYYGTDVYTLQFFHDATSNSALSGMSMDRTFSVSARKRFNEKMFEGAKPKLYYSMLKYLHNPKASHKEPDI